jgi:glycosyltransferase involved in cell wall biosynthesis
VSDRVTLVVGPGDRFLSGVSYYTAELVEALARRGPVGVLVLRRLCPRLIYPGRRRVGRTGGTLTYRGAEVCDGLDWYWFPSALPALRFARRLRPAAVVLQWWTATSLHSYLLIAWLARRAGARVVLDMHEIQDVGEARVPLAGSYARRGLRRLLRAAAAVVVHSEADRDALRRHHPETAGLPVQVVPHAPFDRYARVPVPRAAWAPGKGEPLRLLTFGVVRPYKGHAELAAAVPLLRAAGLDVHVTVVGEVWQGYREPLEQLAAELPADRLSVVDRYVRDDEVAGFFADCHLVVLPYRRSSASGPLSIAIALGLPVVTTSVGGLVEATAGYPGAVLVPPQDAHALAEGIRQALPLVGIQHHDVRSWSHTAERFDALFDALTSAAAGRPAERLDLITHGEIS